MRPVAEHELLLFLSLVQVVHETGNRCPKQEREYENGADDVLLQEATELAEREILKDGYFVSAFGTHVTCTRAYGAVHCARSPVRFSIDMPTLSRIPVFAAYQAAVLVYSLTVTIVHILVLTHGDASIHGAPPLVKVAFAVIRERFIFLGTPAGRSVAVNSLLARLCVPTLAHRAVTHRSEHAVGTADVV